ncbi:hypothetical protein VPH35_025267 [Triticum aestivum]
MGYNMPKGTNIFVNVFAISRDPKYWDNPEEYKPESFENSNVEYYGTHFEFTPFGAMRRQCPGILFAMSTVEITLANLLYHLESICARPGVVCVAEFELAGKRLFVRPEAFVHRETSCLLSLVSSLSPVIAVVQ